MASQTIASNTNQARATLSSRLKTRLIRITQSAVTRSHPYRQPIENACDNVLSECEVLLADRVGKVDDKLKEVRAAVEKVEKSLEVFKCKVDIMVKELAGNMAVLKEEGEFTRKLSPEEEKRAREAAAAKVGSDRVVEEMVGGDFGEGVEEGESF